MISSNYFQMKTYRNSIKGMMINTLFSCPLPIGMKVEYNKKSCQFDIVKEDLV